MEWGQSAPVAHTRARFYLVEVRSIVGKVEDAIEDGGGVNGGRVTPEMEVLAAAWELAGRSYDAFFSSVREGTAAPGDGTEILDAFLTAADALMSCPAGSVGDVLMKYHVMECFVTTRPVPFVETILAHGGNRWHMQVEADADRWGVKLNPFWLWEAQPGAMINGEKDSALWSLLARWRAPSP